MVIPHEVLKAIAHARLPCFIYDAEAITQRAEWASSLLDRFFFPVKACPEPEIVRAVLAVGCGLDLCSEGDLRIAEAVGCSGERWKFTSAHADPEVLGRLHHAGARLDADSLEQALRWGICGGTACGLRITAQKPKAIYGPKFGVFPGQVAVVAHRLADAGLRLDGLHLHDQHLHLTPAEFAARLEENLEDIERDILRRCRYVNIGGSWPMRHAKPAGREELERSLRSLRDRLAGWGFKGALYGEPGRWVVGPCGYWVARVVAIKPHPRGEGHRVVVLDTNTPVPCRPSPGPFLLLRDGEQVKLPGNVNYDLYGTANTALDSMGINVRLPELALEDVVVALGQGAYVRSLIPPFNERERPEAIVLPLA